MKKILLISLLAVFPFSILHAQPLPTWAWTRDVQCSGTSNSSNSFGVTSDGAGNAYITGYFQGTTTVGSNTFTSSGSNDVLVAKYSPQGNVLWSAKGGGTGMDNGNCVAVDSAGNVYVAGFITANATFGNLSVTISGNGYSQIFLAKYDPTGAISWLRTCGGLGNDYIESIAVDAAGNIYVAGSFQQTAYFGNLSVTSAGLQDAFLAKYDANGNPVWIRTVSSVGMESGYGVYCDVNNGVHFIGSFSDTASFSGQTLVSAGGYDVFWAKYDTAGVVQQLHRTGGTASDYGYDIVVHPSGDLHITGGFSNTVVVGGDTLVSAGFNDAFLIRCDPAGDPVDAVRYGGTGTDFGYEIDRTSSNTVVVTGVFENSVSIGATNLVSAGSRDAYLAGFDFNCNPQWAVRAGGTGFDIANATNVDPTGGIYFSGIYVGSSTFGRDTLNSGSRSSLFLSRLRSCDSISVSALQGFCSNGTTQPLTFSATSGNPAYTFSWSPGGSTGSSISVTPAATTEYTVTAQDNAGCVLTAVTTAIVEDPAAFSIIASDDTICLGSPVNLFATWDWNNPLPPPAGYCSITSGSSRADEQILAFSFATMSNTQVDSCGSNYSDYTASIPPVKVNSGGTYPFSVFTDECDGAPYYNSGLSIFIDFNRDGDWNDTSEQAYTSTFVTLSPNTRTGTIEIPTWAATGETRMRVVVLEATLSPGACISVNYGEVEDYLIEIGTGGATNSWSDGTQAASWIQQRPTTTTTYTVSSTSQYGCVATASATIDVIPTPAAAISGPSTVCVPSTFTLDGGAGFTAYAWSSNGTSLGTAQTLSDSADYQWTLDDYVLEVTSANGCTATDTFHIGYSERPADVTVCLVTVDSAGDYNQIIWEKDPVADAVDSFIVYREITTNNFLQVGALPRSAMSVFTDTAENVNATSYKYKIAWRDTCGNFGPLSLYHNTIHLQYLGFGNLQWTNYGIESTANTVASYNVYRDNTSSGNFQLLQVIPGNNNTFTDVNYSSYPNAQYRVDVNWQTGGSCNPTARVVTTSQSNIRRIATTGIFDYRQTGRMTRYPNPANDIVVLDFQALELPINTTLRILSVDGREVWNGAILRQQLTIDVSQWAAGVYTTVISSDADPAFRCSRFVVQ